MAEDKMNPQSLDARIILALETVPRPEIPADFAARITGQLPSRAALVLTPGRYGQRAAAVCLVVLMVLMLAFARLATPGSLYWFSIEFIFCAQFVLLAVWLVVRDYSSASSI
jgi:hypothetical protein